MNADTSVLGGATVSVVVPTFRRPETLAETLQALTASDYPPSLLDIVVVDDGAEPAAARVVAGFEGGPVAVKYRSQERRGAAAARNLGARLALGKVLLFVDDDIILRPDSVRRQLGALARYAPCAVNARWEFAPTLLETLSRTPFGRYRLEIERWVKSRIEKTRLNGTHLEAEGVTACFLAIERDSFWRIGGFDEAFPYAGSEDQEFSIRARAAGLRLIYDEGHEVWHNDRRLSAWQFCERQRRGTVSAVYLAAKYPASHASRPLIAENLRILPSDSRRLTLKKLAKTALALRPAYAALFVLAGLLERLWPKGPILPKLYGWLCGIAIFKGVREGVGTLRPDEKRAVEAAASGQRLSLTAASDETPPSRTI